MTNKKKITKGLLILFLFTLGILGNCGNLYGTTGESEVPALSAVEKSDSSPLRDYDGKETSFIPSSYLISNPYDFSRDDQVMERPTVGSARALAIPVDFSDQQHTTSTITIDSRWDNLENSVRTYYLENSFDKLSLTVDVLPWVQAPLPISYYAHNDYQVSREMELANWLLNYWDSYILYSNYNYVFIIYAGSDAHDNSHFWPHVWTWTSGSLPAGDGVSYDKLGFVGEYTSMGTYAHEFGHSLGLVDYYSTSGDFYCGYWELMAYGNYNGGGNYPAHASTYSKIELGWIEETQVLTLDAAGNVAYPTIRALEDPNCPENEYYAVKIPFDVSCYYLVEFRDDVGYDQYLPDHGILTSFVNESKGSAQGRLVYWGGDHSSPTLPGVELDDSETDPAQNFVRWLTDDFELTVAAVKENEDSMEVYVDRHTDVGSGYSAYYGLAAGQALYWFYDGLTSGDVLVFFWDTTAGSGSDFYLERLVEGSWVSIATKIDKRQDAFLFRIVENGDYRVRIRNNNLMFAIDVFYKEFALSKPSVEVTQHNIINSFYLVPGDTQLISFWATISNSMPAWDESVNVSLSFSENLIAIVNGSTFQEIKEPIYRAEKTFCWEFVAFERGIVNLSIRIQGKHSSSIFSHSFAVLNDTEPPLITSADFQSFQQRVQIGWSSEDGESGVAYCELSLNDEFYGRYFESSASLDVHFSEEGMYQFNITAFDYFGNQESRFFHAIYDVTPPELVEILSKTTDVWGIYTLEIEVYENVIPFVRVEISINGTQVSSFSSNESLIEFTFNTSEYASAGDKELLIGLEMRDIVYNFCTEYVTLYLAQPNNPEQAEQIEPMTIWLTIIIMVISSITVLSTLNRKKKIISS
jgi:immune inhibitor A